MTFYVYTIYNKVSDKIYIGQTNNLERRLQEHNYQDLKVGGKYTSKYNGRWIVFYSREYDSRSGAMLREKQLKSSQGRIFLKKILNERGAPG